MFVFEGTAASLEFTDSILSIGNPATENLPELCNSYLEQFGYFLHAESIANILIRNITYFDVCKPIQAGIYTGKF